MKDLVYHSAAMGRTALAGILLLSAFALGDNVPEWRRKRVQLDECFVQGEFRLFYTLKGPNAIPIDHRADRDKDGIPDKIQNIARQLITARRLYVEVFGLRHPFEGPRYKGRVRYFDVHVTELPITPGGGKNGSAGDGIVNYLRPTDPPGGYEVLTIDISNRLSDRNLTPTIGPFPPCTTGS